MNTNPFLAQHILNRVWSYLLHRDCGSDEMWLIEGLQDQLIEESPSSLDMFEVITLLGDINLWANWHTVPTAIDALIEKTLGGAA